MKRVVKEHKLVPQHEKLGEKEKLALFDKYHISGDELPKIKKKDPSLAGLSAKSGDIIKITRKSPTAGEAVFYRVVIVA